MSERCPVCGFELGPADNTRDHHFFGSVRPSTGEAGPGWDKETGKTLIEAINNWFSCEMRLRAARMELEQWKSWYDEAIKYIPEEERLNRKLDEKAPQSETLLTFLEQTEDSLGSWLINRNLWIW